MNLEGKIEKIENYAGTTTYTAYAYAGKLGSGVNYMTIEFSFSNEDDPKYEIGDNVDIDMQVESQDTTCMHCGK